MTEDTAAPLTALEPERSNLAPPARAETGGLRRLLRHRHWQRVLGEIALIVVGTRMETLRADLVRGIVPRDSAHVLYGAVLRVWELQLNRGVYEALKEKGLDLISNDSLRLAIAALYENAYVNIDQSQADDRPVIFDLVRPYYLRKFRDIRFGGSATPVNAAAVARDAYFRNLLDYRLASLRANPIPSIEAAMSQVTGLLAHIDTAIARQW